MLKIPILKFRRLCCGDMIQLSQCMTYKQVSDVTLQFNTIPVAVTTGNKYKISQDHVSYDLRKFCFSNRVRTLWNSLPDIVVKA